MNDVIVPQSKSLISNLLYQHGSQGAIRALLPPDGLSLAPQPDKSTSFLRLIPNKLGPCSDMSIYRLVFADVFGASRTPEERRSQVASERHHDLDQCSFGLALEARLGQVYDEEAFRYFLEIERKRSELSCRPFLLLLIDLQKQPETSLRTDAAAANLFSALSLCLRETDFIGWYDEGRVAGAVLTQDAAVDGADVPEIVGQRISTALRERLSAEADRIQVQVLRLPPVKVQN